MSTLVGKPWRVIDFVQESRQTGHLHVAGPYGEKICDIFPYAGVGGVGYEAAKIIAHFIVEQRNGAP